VIKKKAICYVYLLILLIISTSCETNKKPKAYSINEKVESKNPEFEKCLDDKKIYRGKLSFNWQIGSNSKAFDVKVVKDEVKDDELITCFSKVLKTIRFSTFGLHYNAKVKSYTFVFSKAKTKKK